jgi:hypothetical protein
MATIHVLKSFRFTEKTPTAYKEHLFTVGDHEISDEMAAHPFIARDFADGHIERPEATLERLKAAEEKAAREALIAKQAKDRADASMARLQNNATVQAQSKELSTPLSAPAPALDLTDPDVQKALHTPANVLQEQTAAKLNEAVIVKPETLKLKKG